MDLKKLPRLMIGCRCLNGKAQKGGAKTSTQHSLSKTIKEDLKIERPDEIGPILSLFRSPTAGQDIEKALKLAPGSYRKKKDLLDKY